MDYHDLLSEGRAWLLAHYPAYDRLPDRERAVLACAWLCDVKKPRESTGSNDGPLIEAIQASGGGSKGQSWCAYAQKFVAVLSQTWAPRTGSGAVLEWIAQARKQGRLIPVSSAVRGDCLARDPGDGTHHIGRCLFRLGPIMHSIEGNTSPGESGSQSNGQGMYRRTRLSRFWTHAIRI